MKIWILIIISVCLVAALVISTINFGQNQKTIKISLDERMEVAPVRQMVTGDQTEPGEDVLRVAIAGVLSPSSTLEHYQEFLNYLGRQLGRKVVMILKPTYSEINDLIRGGRVDIAFVCSLAYVKGNRDFGMELLVVPQIRGETEYYSYLIVNRRINAAGINDLRGASFAFTDPLSNSGHLAPVYQLSLIREKPASFFNKYIFTYSHNNSIIAVADGLVDGAAVDSLIYDQFVLNDPHIVRQMKIVSRWGPYGMPPIVAGLELDDALKQELINLLLNMHASQEGRTILNDLEIDKFVVITDDRYNSIREMEKELGW